MTTHWSAAREGRRGPCPQPRSNVTACQQGSRRCPAWVARVRWPAMAAGRASTRVGNYREAPAQQAGRRSAGPTMQPLNDLVANRGLACSRGSSNCDTNEQQTTVEPVGIALTDVQDSSSAAAYRLQCLQPRR